MYNFRKLEIFHVSCSDWGLLFFVLSEFEINGCEMLLYGIMKMKALNTHVDS